MGIVSDFLAKVKPIHLDFEPRCVINMDETPVYIDMPHNITMHPVGDKTIDMATSGYEKIRFTVTITLSADGRVWPAFMILRGLKKIMEDYKAHRKAQVIQKLNSLKISHEIIPGGFTSSLQPLDVSLNKPFKDYYREEWNKWMDSPNPIYTKGRNRQKPSYQELEDWVSRSVDKLALKEEMIARSFVTTGILNSSEDSISHFNHRLQSLLKCDDDWDLEEFKR